MVEIFEDVSDDADSCVDSVVGSVVEWRELRQTTLLLMTLLLMCDIVVDV